MKFSALIGGVLIAAACAGSALAAPFGDGMRMSPPVQDQRPGPAGRERGAEKSFPRRDMRDSGEADRSRMNPEERRQLRRDIQDAGEDIYRRGPQRRGEGRRSGRR